MRRKSDELTVIPDKARLYKQSGSRNYYCAIRLDNGKWERKATGTDVLEEARATAHQLYQAAQFAAQHNLPQTTRTFSGIAKAVVAQLEQYKDTGQWKQVYKHYISALNNSAIPYYHNTPLTQIKSKADGYLGYVAEQLGRMPSKSTVATHHSALNMVFDYAVQAQYMTVLNVPKLNSVGTESKRRATFELSEYRRVINGLNAWRKQKTHRKRDAEIRNLLYDYVLILANTGIRHGREAMDLKWQNISFEKSPNGNHLTVLNVLKKKGRKGTHEWRKVVMRDTHNNARRVLERLKDRQSSIQNKTIEQLIREKSEAHVFALPNGTQPGRIDGTFKRFLESKDLLLDEKGEPRTLYSWRHFYASTELRRKQPISVALLAKQLGTSIKMIEEHYGHLDTVKQGDALSGRTRW